jgi:hypothetical protein
MGGGGRGACQWRESWREHRDAILKASEPSPHNWPTDSQTPRRAPGPPGAGAQPSRERELACMRASFSPLLVTPGVAPSQDAVCACTRVGTCTMQGIKPPLDVHSKWPCMRAHWLIESRPTQSRRRRVLSARSPRALLAALTGRAQSLPSALPTLFLATHAALTHTPPTPKACPARTLQTVETARLGGGHDCSSPLPTAARGTRVVLALPAPPPP